MEDPATPWLVYHYTTIANLVKIVELDQLWATHISYLNDVSERNFFLNAVKERATSFCARHNLNATELLKLLTESQAEKDLDELPFIASFTTHRNSLPQWRAYCSQGNGVSIGFRTDQLSRDAFAGADDYIAMQGFVPYTEMRPVTYLDQLNSTLLDSILEEMFLDMERTFGSAGDNAFGLSAEELTALSIQNRASFIKHNSFASEQEWRLLVAGVNMRMNKNLLGVRTSRTTLLPYIKVPLALVERSSIQEMVVGPCPNPELSVQALEMFSLLHDLVANVAYADLPYRDL